MFQNHPVVGKIDVVCDFLGKSHLMGNEDAGHPFLGEFLDSDQDLFHRLGIKGRGDLVKKHHIGIHRQGTCDRNTLLLWVSPALLLLAGALGLIWHFRRRRIEGALPLSESERDELERLMTESARESAR